jgi:hypothetical protein
MFTVKPLAKNRPTPVPFSFVDIGLDKRYVTTNAVRYDITDDKVFVVRMTNTQKKEVILPAAPAANRFIIVQDIGGSTVDTPCDIKCTGSKTFVDGTPVLTFSTGNNTVVLKYNGATYDIVEYRDEYQQSYITGSMPDLTPIRDGDTSVEAVDDHMLILLGNPNRREVTFRKPSLPIENGVTATTYPIQFFVVIDSVGSAATYPIKMVFDGCTCNGNSTYTVTGASMLLMLKTDPGGNYVLWEYSGATFSDYTISPTDKLFGFVSEDYPYYSTTIRGFSTIIPPTSGGKFNTLGA